GGGPLAYGGLVHDGLSSAAGSGRAHHAGRGAEGGERALAADSPPRPRLRAAALSERAGHRGAVAGGRAGGGGLRLPGSVGFGAVGLGAVSRGAGVERTGLGSKESALASFSGARAGPRRSVASGLDLQRA